MTERPQSDRRRGLVPRTVRARTSLGAAVALCLIVALSGLIVERLVVTRVEAAADGTLRDQAVDRAQLLAAGARPDSLVNVIGDEVLAVVFAPDGSMLAAAGTDEGAMLAELPTGLSTVTVTVIENHDGEDHDGEGEEPAHRERIRVAVAETADGARVVVGNEGEATRATVGAVRLILALGAPLVAAAGAAVAWLVTGRALAPVHRLRDDLEGVTRSGGQVGEPDTDDEIQSLAQATNEVLARLDRQSAARRRFVADASHELKSPIANARVLVDTGERLPSPELRRRMGAELDRLQSLVDDLLFLARTDETAPPAPAPFDLDDVLFDEAERATLATELPIEAGGVRPARVLGDRAEVARAVRNLLDNAVRHARSRVTLAVEDGGDQWVVVVADDGAGVPAADRERIFERFTRLEADRARTGGGTGLGLSIVATIAGRNNGSVRLLDGPGARFELSLPAAPASPHPPS